MKIKSLLIVAVLVTAFLCSGSFVKAQAIDNSALIAKLQAEIQSLIQQIAQLQSQQGSTQVWCHTFITYSLLGATDATTNGEVTQLQTALTKSGFDVSADTAGVFGQATLSAVESFQKENRINQTGTVGPKTRMALNSKYGCPIPKPNLIQTCIDNLGPCQTSDPKQPGYCIDGTCSNNDACKCQTTDSGNGSIAFKSRKFHT